MPPVADVADVPVIAGAGVEGVCELVAAVSDATTARKVCASLVASAFFK
jgi:imidazole glycerol phosphate synthase subunit HisF